MWLDGRTVPDAPDCRDYLQIRLIEPSSRGAQARFAQLGVLGRVLDRASGTVVTQ